MISNFLPQTIGLSRKLKSKWHRKKPFTGICKCKVYPLSTNNILRMEGTESGSLWSTSNKRYLFALACEQSWLTASYKISNMDIALPLVRWEICGSDIRADHMRWENLKIINLVLFLNFESTLFWSFSSSFAKLKKFCSAYYLWFLWTSAWCDCNIVHCKFWSTVGCQCNIIIVLLFCLAHLHTQDINNIYLMHKHNPYSCPMILHFDLRNM